MHAVDDLSRRSLRELLTLARERLGRGAAGLKTRGELIAALRHDEAVGGAERARAASVASSGSGPAATDLAATGGGAMANAPDPAWAPAAGGVASGSVAEPPPGASISGAVPAAGPDVRVAKRSPAEPPRAGDVPTVVTRDFFIARH